MRSCCGVHAEQSTNTSHAPLHPQPSKQARWRTHTRWGACGPLSSSLGSEWRSSRLCFRDARVLCWIIHHPHIHPRIPCHSYVKLYEILLERAQPRLADALRLAADHANLPLLVHCIHGGRAGGVGDGAGGSTRCQAGLPSSMTYCSGPVLT